MPQRWLRNLLPILAVLVTWLAFGSVAWASEAGLAIPDLHHGSFPKLGGISPFNLLLYGSFVICGTLGISLYLRSQIHALPAHRSMLNVAEIIYATCKTYLIQQGKFLLMLWVLIAFAIAYYLLGTGHEPEAAATPEGAALTAQATITPITTLVLVLFFSVVGM